MRKLSTPFFIAVIAICLVMIGPNLFSDGMFLDGLLYSGVSKNLSDNVGSFWNLTLTEYLLDDFNAQPPLVFGIQSIFFRVIGESIYTERIYSLICFIITAYILTLIWKRVTKKEYHNFVWLPLLFFISFPLVSWSVANNMLENTMMIFTSLATLYIFNSLRKRRFLWLILAGFSLFLGVFSKGLIALFPLALLFWIWIFDRNIKFLRFVTDLMFVSLSCLLPLVLIIHYSPEGKTMLTEYFNLQIIGSFDELQNVNSRFYIIGQLLQQIIPAVIMIVVIYFTAIRKKFKFIKDGQISKFKLIMMSLALSGIVPVMLSLKQRGFYIVVAFPIMAVALALFVAPQIHFLVSKISIKKTGFKIFRALSYLLLFISITISALQINRIGRDKELLNDVYKMIEIIPEKSTVMIHPELIWVWNLHGYFYRHASISLDSTVMEDYNYSIVNINTKDERLSNFKKVNIEFKRFDLYKKHKNTH